MVHDLKAEIGAIFWDFDGVLLNSNETRNNGFSEVLKEYPLEEVNKLLEFHRINGGLSRYVKFRYFFENIRNEHITDQEVTLWAERFSVIIKRLLTDPKLQIQQTLDFVKVNYSEMPMYIVSGSDQEELRYLCKSHGIDSYFKRIHGSPKPKKEWVATILHEEQLAPNNCLLVGDSVNDYEAAFSNNLYFMSYDNSELDHFSDVVIDLR